ncbi:hypothetical protein NM688_g6317 [Phlebia brevispora]|uniref:Uncharacterized protein n=1 Tax=Phlebia brevispora TaxID=194682 RepID=A0ACC1SH98_9APHY|nr:hypothetical protein NM688_g6317 [Phlebia brevispora]
MDAKPEAMSDVEKASFEEPSTASVSDTGGAEKVVDHQIAEEHDHEIKYRTCSWQKTAALLFSEYICLAILSFPWSYSVLGMAPGVIVTIAVAASVQYTSLILWRFCLKHPEVRDVCDIGKILFGGSQLAYNITALFFILNNIFIQALHCLVGAKLLNTLTNGRAACTVVWSLVTAVVCFFVSLPRPLAQMSALGLFSAITMGIAVLLSMIFAGVQDHPFGYIVGQVPLVTRLPVKGTTYVAGMSAFLNITYTFVGQITLPSFIAEMKNPKDFPKALWAVTIAEVVVFTLCGAIVYNYVGNQYMTAPAFGSLALPYKKIAFSFAIPTIIFLGSLYASVSARFVFFRLFRNSKHRHSNTVIGWSVWAGIIAILWALAFVIAEVIPFFSDMLSLMSSLFDSWFGFVFWGMAYLTFYPGAKKWAGFWRSFETLLNYAIILLGFYVLVAGTYTSVKSIIIDFNGQKVFSCRPTMVPAPNTLFKSLEPFGPVDETAHIGTIFPSDSVQLSAFLNAGNSDELIHDLATLVAHRGVVFFKNQDLTIQQQKELGLRLGQLSGRPAESSLHKHPVSEDTPELGADTSVISSSGGIARAGYVPNIRASFGWHADITFEPVPSDYAILKMHTLPQVGGDTLWASAYEAYDRLSPALQRFLEGLTAEHDGNFFHNTAKQLGVAIQKDRGNPANNGEDLRAIHPVVRTNPVTGYKGLFVNKSFTKRIIELHPEESDTLLDYLFRQVSENHDLQVRYKWGINDVAIWDNRSTFHTATNDYSAHRQGNRVVGIGEKPYFDPASKSRRSELKLTF